MGIQSLSQALMDQLLAHFILPCLIGSLNPIQESNKDNLISPKLALFILSQVNELNQMKSNQIASKGSPVGGRAAVG